tara:strand:+ start:17197 stop:17934 length:738 start_codon:yes stop_codon:yes gene_type:complete
MAEGKKSFTAYCDWQETFNSLPDDKAGQLIKHLFAYVNDENPESDDLLIKAVFAQIKATLKRDLKKWEAKREQNKENALKRWNKNNATECDRIQTDAKNAVSDSVSVSDSVNTLKEKNVRDLEVNLSGGEGEFKDQLLNDLKEVEPKYSETDFLDNWATCRKHFLKQQTFIKSLNFHERTEFDRVKKQYNKEEINAAMQVLFKQERIPVEAMVLRPKHFLEKFDTYYSAGKSTKIYATKQKQTEY